MSTFQLEVSTVAEYCRIAALADSEPKSPTKTIYFNFDTITKTQTENQEDKLTT
ncbi:hypothetical protein KUC3_11700 [Alteromonas sp. KC3]|nr:hypothetical protein KUC3_11700 [Alteromonas sp. KC3]BCO22273.1 hypothetical protein KUC14_11420 [Alteromonas sp. KC14]